MPINRRDLLKAGTVQAGATLMGTALNVKVCSGQAAAGRGLPSVEADATNTNMYDYLSREARRITAHAGARCDDVAAWRKSVTRRRLQYMEMMGLEELPPSSKRPPLNVKVTGVIERPHYRIEKLYYESVPKLYVTANLYVPRHLTSRAPGVLYVCGHRGPGPEQKYMYQAHARRFAELGFVSLLVETLEGGEVRGVHFGPRATVEPSDRAGRSPGTFHWYSRGYTPGGIELLNGIRGLDLLAQRPEVDDRYLGVTGISGGGAASWWIAAGDERVQAAAPVCGTSTLATYMDDRTVDENCDCIWFTNAYQWDLADVGALIAPRALLIADAVEDDSFAISGVRELHSQLQRLYTALHVPNRLRLVETPGYHSYHALSRTAVFSWFLKFLRQKDVPASDVGDIEEAPASQESEASLRVYTDGSPSGNRVLTIQDDFPVLAKPRVIADRAALEAEKQRVLRALHDKTFRFFPATPRSLNLRLLTPCSNGNVTMFRFSFNSEGGWRLHGRGLVPRSARTPAPAVVILRSPGEELRASENLARTFRARAPWATLIVEPRGTGETAWGQELQWHFRRATAWTGRTIASMQVYDVLCGLRAARSTVNVKGDSVSLAACGDMAAVALYASLLDGNVRTLFLEAPPATQNAPSSPDARGSAIEMLNCLRVTDLGQVAGLLFPTELVIVGDLPLTYQWAEDLYRELGRPDAFQRIAKINDWRPSLPG